MSRSKRKLAAVNRDSKEQQPSDNLSRNTNALRVKEDYITQVSEHLERRMIRKILRILAGQRVGFQAF